MSQWKMSNKEEYNWWDGAVIYQIYPRSFRDSSCNGIGDLQGVIEKLDYITSLGVDAIWLSPFFQSPQADFGYDVSDYRKIDPMFGNNYDFKNLLCEAHKRNIKVIVDMVLPHTSNKHAWFQESQSDRTNSKADWYVWADPRPDGTEPNNWLSHFGGHAWTWSQRRKQYYLHHFLKEQPNLNYYNDDVCQAMLGVCKFWLDEGVDGFRLDAILTLAHDKYLRDNPPRPREDLAHHTSGRLVPFDMQLNQISQMSQPLIFDFIRKLRILTNQYTDRLLIGEIGGEDGMAASSKFTRGDDLLHTTYNFDMLSVDDLESGQLEAIAQRSLQLISFRKIAFAVSNHDVMRAVTRWSKSLLQPKKLDDDAMRRVAFIGIMLISCLHGQAFVYQGEELGLPEADVPFHALQDPYGKEFWPEFKGRDGCRTPMPWNNNVVNCNFSSVVCKKLWLPIPPTHYPLAVNNQAKDTRSCLSLSRRWLTWRKIQPAFRQGSICIIEEVPKPIFAFERKWGTQVLLCMFNFSCTEVMVSLKRWCGDVVVVPECSFDSNIIDDCVLMPAFSSVVMSVF